MELASKNVVAVIYVTRVPQALILESRRLISEPDLFTKTWCNVTPVACGTGAVALAHLGQAWWSE